MDQGQGHLHCVIERGQRTILNTSPEGSSVLQQQMDRYKEDYERLRHSLNEARSDLEATLQQWAEFEMTLNRLNTWMKDTEQKIKTETQPHATLAEKKAQLEKVKVSSEMTVKVRLL